MAISKALSLLSLLAAVGIACVRINVSNIKRTTIAHQKEMPLGFFESDPSMAQSIRIVERGANVEIEGQIGPRASGFYPRWPGSPPMHVHVDEDEVFTVLSGTMGYILDGEEGVTTKGGTMTMGKDHTFWNADPTTPLKVRIKLINKTGRTHQGDRFFENLAGLAQHYGELGSINPLQTFLTAKEGGIVYTFVPAPLRPIVQYVLCPLAKLVGYKAFYPEYRSSAP